MKTPTGILAALFWVAAMLMHAAASATPPAEVENFEPAEALLDLAIEHEHLSNRFDGVVLVGRRGEVVYQRAIGFADRETHRPHRVDEPWRLASVSKQVAALLVMKEVEQGRIALDSRLRDLIPDFRSPLADQITLKQLLQHTSGLPNPDATLQASAPADAMPAYYTRSFNEERGPVDAALEYCAGEPTGLPGSRFMYTNCDTLVVQAVLENITGKSYSELVQEAVAVPLGLKHWHMVSPKRPALGLPTGYLDTKNVEPAFNLASFGASGALVGSAEDLWRFDQALMANRLLGESATQQMWSGDPKLGYVALGAWSFSASLAGCGKPVALVERRGEIGGVQVRNLMAPALGAAVIVLSNTAQTDFGEIWQGKGWMHELASDALCKPVRHDLDVEPKD